MARDLITAGVGPTPKRTLYSFFSAAPASVRVPTPKQQQYGGGGQDGKTQAAIGQAQELLAGAEKKSEAARSKEDITPFLNHLLNSLIRPFLNPSSTYLKGQVSPF